MFLVSDSSSATRIRNDKIFYFGILNNEFGITEKLFIFSAMNGLKEYCEEVFCIYYDQ